MQSAGRVRGGDPIDDGAFQPEELAFVDQDERLPWLEGDGDLDENQVDTGRVIAFALVGVLVLGLIIGGLWFYLRGGPESRIVADGSTIEAPDQPYKMKPGDAGGTKALGTGATSFEVAEGQSPEGRVAVREAPRPSAEVEEAKSDETPEKPVPAGVGVQVGAYSSRERAEAGWTTLAGRFSALDGVKHRIVEATVDGSPIFRLQAVPGDLAAARALCDSLQASGGDCQVKN
jgi:hypothetical protein